LGLHNRLDYLYNSVCPDCGGAVAEHSHNAELAAGKNPLEQFSKGLLKSFSNAFKKLYTNKGYKPEDLTKEPEFKKAIESTYEVLNFGIKDNVVDGTLLRKLQQDTFLFSAFKTHAELTEAASRLLLNADKKIRPWFDFKQEVLKLHQTYNVNYLEAEYEFAKQSSMMADKWQRADDNYWLQYRTAGDERVRESHAALHDTTLPKSDPFWSHYYPPNGWRCRCTTVSVRPEKYPMSDNTEAIKKGEAATTQIGKDGKNKLEIFRFNPGKEQVVFPKNNAYSKVVGAGVVSDSVSNLMAKNSADKVREWSHENLVGKVISAKDKPSFILSGHDVKSIVGKPHLNRQVRNELLYNLQEYYINSAPVGFDLEKKGRPQYKYWYYYRIEIDSQDYIFNVALTEQKRFKLHAITDSIKKK